MTVQGTYDVTSMEDIIYNNFLDSSANFTHSYFQAFRPKNKDESETILNDLIALIKKNIPEFSDLSIRRMHIDDGRKKKFVRAILSSDVGYRSNIYVRGSSADGDWWSIEAFSEHRLDDAFASAIGQIAPWEHIVEDGKTPVNIWYASGHGQMTYVERKIDTENWDEISPNYTQKVRKSLDRLNSFVPSEDGTTHGKIILFSGAPGTGKTHAISALAESWRPWVKTHFVNDPEVAFGSTASLMQIISEDRHSMIDLDDNLDDSGEPLEKWNLFVFEDTGELLTADAKSRTGQGLSRLLNITDGILGAGTNSIFLLSTNEAVDSLHPAVTRPGRCLANIVFSELTEEEATNWLKNHNIECDNPPLDLASLYSEVTGGFISVDDSTDDVKQNSLGGYV